MTKGPLLNTHSLTCETVEEGIKRAIAISLLSDQSYGITFTTTQPGGEPQKTRIRLSPVAMTMLSEASHEAMHSMHKYKLTEEA